MILDGGCRARMRANTTLAVCAGATRNPIDCPVHWSTLARHRQLQAGTSQYILCLTRVGSASFCVQHWRACSVPTSASECCAHHRLVTPRHILLSLSLSAHMARTCRVTVSLVHAHARVTAVLSRTLFSAPPRASQPRAFLGARRTVDGMSLHGSLMSFLRCWLRTSAPQRAAVLGNLPRPLTMRW